MELAQHPNELLFFYDSSSQRARQGLAFAQSVSSHINLWDLRATQMTKNVWQELLTLLDMEPKELLDKSHPEYQEKIRGRSFTMDHWLDVLVHNPQLIKAPIAVKNRKAVLCINPKEVLKLDPYVESR